ncbi:hypothetical protein PENTCL1PPCAC_15296, partial [Pristionchus entomophagus]
LSCRLNALLSTEKLMRNGVGEVWVCGDLSRVFPSFLHIFSRSIQSNSELISIKGTRFSLLSQIGIIPKHDES